MSDTLDSQELQSGQSGIAEHRGDVADKSSHKQTLSTEDQDTATLDQKEQTHQKVEDEPLDHKEEAEQSQEEAEQSQEEAHQQHHQDGGDDRGENGGQDHKDLPSQGHNQESDQYFHPEGVSDHEQGLTSELTSDHQLINGTPSESVPEDHKEYIYKHKTHIIHKTIVEKVTISKIHDQQHLHVLEEDHSYPPPPTATLIPNPSPLNHLSLHLEAGEPNSTQPEEIEERQLLENQGQGDYQQKEDEEQQQKEELEQQYQQQEEEQQEQQQKQEKLESEGQQQKQEEQQQKQQHIKEQQQGQKVELKQKEEQEAKKQVVQSEQQDVEQEEEEEQEQEQKQEQERQNQQEQEAQEQQDRQEQQEQQEWQEEQKQQNQQEQQEEKKQSEVVALVERTQPLLIANTTPISHLYIERDNILQQPVMKEESMRVFPPQLVQQPQINNTPQQIQDQGSHTGINKTSEGSQTIGTYQRKEISQKPVEALKAPTVQRVEQRGQEQVYQVVPRDTNQKRSEVVQIAQVEQKKRKSLSMSQPHPPMTEEIRLEELPVVVPLPVESQPKQVLSQVMIVPEDVIIPNANMMYSSAFEERREINRKLVIQYLEKRNSYYSNHIAVFDHIRLGLLLRIKLAREGVDSFKAFYNEQIEAYKPLIYKLGHIEESHSKVQAQTLDIHWSPAITAGIYQNVEDQFEILEMAKSYRSLIGAEVILPLDQAFKDYEQELQRCENASIEKRKLFCNFEEKVVGMQKDLHKKFKAEKGHPHKKNKAYDLTEEELMVLRDMKIANKRLTDWGESLIVWWEEQIRQETQLLTKVKEQVTRFVDITNRIHVLSKDLVQKCNQWNKMDVKTCVLDNLDFENIVCLTDIDFVRGCLEMYNHLKKSQMLTLEDVRLFNQLKYDERITGKKDIIIEGLVTKAFKCRREPAGSDLPGDLTVYATIDDNLLLVDQEQTVLRISLKEMMNTRPESDLVKLNYKQKGWFFDDWKSVLLRFSTPDSAEEFIFFTETDPALRREYLI